MLGARIAFSAAQTRLQIEHEGRRAFRSPSGLWGEYCFGTGPNRGVELRQQLLPSPHSLRARKEVSRNSVAEKLRQIGAVLVGKVLAHLPVI